MGGTFETPHSVKAAAMLTVATALLESRLRIWWYILALFVVYSSILLAWYQYRMHVKLRGFPCPNYLYVLGHLNIVTGSNLAVFRVIREIRAKYGSRMYLNIINEFTIHISEPDSVEVMLSCPKNLTKGLLYNFLHSWLGEGLLTSTGQVWANHRKLLTPAFHFSILEKLAVRIQFHSEKFAETLEELLGGDSRGDIDLMPHIINTTLASILEVAMGVTLKEAGDDYVKSTHVVSALASEKTTRPWLWNDFFYNLLPKGRRYAKHLKVLHGFSSKVIAERKAFFHSKQESNLVDDNDSNEMGIRKKLAFLDVLLTAQMSGAQISDLDIRNQVDTITFEGHDTSAMGIYWTLYLLADHPEIQERLREEVQSVELKDVTTLPYLDRVIRESLRLYPSVPFLGRRIEHPIKFGENQVAVPPVSVYIHVYDLHRDPKYFPDPLKFDPDRVYPSHPFAYIPFSGGSRNCIGRRLALLELKLVVAATLRRIRLGKPPIPHLEVPIPIDVVLRPGIDIKIPLEVV